jgi:hypothetical protein
MHWFVESCLIQHQATHCPLFSFGKATKMVMLLEISSGTEASYTIQYQHAKWTELNEFHWMLGLWGKCDVKHVFCIMNAAANDTWHIKRTLMRWKHPGSPTAKKLDTLSEEGHGKCLWDHQSIPFLNPWSMSPQWVLKYDQSFIHYKWFQCLMKNKYEPHYLCPRNA